MAGYRHRKTVGHNAAEGGGHVNCHAPNDKAEMRKAFSRVVAGSSPGALYCISPRLPEEVAHAPELDSGPGDGLVNWHKGG